MAPNENVFKIAPTEAETQRAILQYLRMRGYICWRNNSGVFRPENPNGTHRFVRFGAVGTSDIIGLTKDGRFFAIEVKRKGAKPTVEQFSFLQNVRESNGIAILAYSLDDVIERL